MVCSNACAVNVWASSETLPKSDKAQNIIAVIRVFLFILFFISN